MSRLRPDPRRAVTAALVLLLSGCDSAADSLQEADGSAAAPTAAVFRYNREYVFVAPRGEAPIVVPFTFRATDAGGELQRSAQAWFARGATWDRFLDESTRTSRAGGVWRVVPMGDLRLIAGGPIELETLRFERGERRLRLELGEPVTGWNQGGETRFRFMSGRLAIGQESIPGPVLEVLRVEQTLDDGWPPGQDLDALFLSSGDSLQWVMVESIESDGSETSYAWSRTPTVERRLGPVEIRWLEVRPYQDARRDIPRRWSFRTLNGELEGEVEAVGFDALLGPERGGRREVEVRFSVRGSIETPDGVYEVAGMIRHTQQ